MTKPVLVETFVGDELESEKTLDMSMRQSREWLMKHISWAVHSGREVAVKSYDT